MLRRKEGRHDPYPKRLAGALFACTIALFLGGTMPLAPAAALALIACALFVTAARQARRP